MSYYVLFKICILHLSWKGTFKKLLVLFLILLMRNSTNMIVRSLTTPPPPPKKKRERERNLNPNLFTVATMKSNDTFDFSENNRRKRVDSNTKIEIWELQTWKSSRPRPPIVSAELRSLLLYFANGRCLVPWSPRNKRILWKCGSLQISGRRNWWS